MSAKAAPIAPSAPARRPTRKRKVSLWAGSVAVASGVAMLLAGGSASDVTDLSDALGVPVETTPLPAFG